MSNVEHLFKMQEQQLARLQQSLTGYCIALTGSRWEADDLVQDTWLKLLAKRGQSGHPNVEALLFRTAKNTWIDRTRRTHRWHRVLHEPQWADKITDHAVPFSRLEIEEAVRLLLTRLTPLQASVLLMRGVLGYSIAETSQVLETTEGAVKAAYFRAQKVLEDYRKSAKEPDRVSADIDPETEERIRAVANAIMAGNMKGVISLFRRMAAAPYVRRESVYSMMMAA
jgi:RNA polymerase sigma-70 factor (ECF subfamily)